MILNIRPLRPAQQLASQPHHNLGGTPRQSSNLSETFPQRRVRAATLNVDKEHDLSLPTDDGDIYPGGEDDAAIDPTQSTLMVLLQTLPNAMHSALLSPLQTVSKVYRRGVLEWNQTRPHSEREQVYCFGEESVMVLRRANGTRNGQAVWYQRDHSHGIAMRSKIRFPGPISVATGAFSATGRLFALASSGGDKGVTVFVLEHGSFELQEHEDGIPIAGQVAGLGFTPRHSSLLVCTKRGEVFCCLRQQQSALQFAPAVLLSSVVAANTAQPALMDTNFALLQGEKLYSSNTCAVSVCVLHEQSSPEQPPRLIPFQRIEFASSPLTLASTVDDVFRKALGIPPWCDLQQVQRCEVNSDTTKLAMTTGMHELVVVDVQTGRELGRRGNVLAFTWFSTWELAVLQHSPAASTLLVCSIEELQGNLMDPAVDAPTGLKSLCNGSGDAVTALGRNNALMLVQPCSPEQVLEQMLAGNDFHSALEFCARKHLPVDSVHKKMFDTNPVSSETIANHLAAVSDWDWVGATCLDRIPADRDNALALLQFGLDSSPTHFPHLQSEFQSQLQRLEAYRQTFAEFDSKSYQKFRVAPCANAIAEQLASQGMVRELHVFLLETVWGKEHAQASLACGFVSEAVPPAEYETLLKLANKSAEWYVNRALEIDDQSGLLRHALEMLEIGARSQLPPPLPLLEALDSAKHLVRLVYSLHLDFSLSLRVWMFNMPVADRIRVCYTDQLDLFVARVFPLYVDLSPVQQKPWLAAMQDFLSQVANLRLVHQVLFTTDLMYKNRVDGRLFVLQVMVNVLPLCGDDLEAFDRLWRDVNALDLAVETVMWPKRFAALRGELAEIHTRWKTQQLCQRRGLTVSMSTLKRAALEQDSALLNRFLDPIRLWQQGNDGDLVQYACDEAVRLGQFLSVSVDQVLVLALKQVLLNGALNHVVASVFNHKLGNELLIEAYGFALREWFLRDLAFPNALECLQTAPQGLELEPFGRLLQLAALLPPTVLSPAELLLGLECNSSELLKRIIIECDFSLALRAAPLLGIEMETLVSLLVQHGQLKQAQTMVDHVLLHSDAATELERFHAARALSGLDFYRVQALLLAPSGKELLEMLEGVGSNAAVVATATTVEHMATSWIEDETSWKRCCAAAALASRGGEQSLLPATVQSELGCLTLLNSVELEQGRFDRLDARNEIKARLGKAFPQIHLDLKQQDPIKRFQIISSTLRIPTTGSPGCFDLNRELSDEFVCAFFRALKHRQVTESEFQGFRPEYFAYAQEKLSGELCVDAELKLQLLESLSPDPEPLRAKRLALHDLLAISPNLNLKQIGFGEQGADSKDRALVAIVEQLTYCPDPVKFAKLVSAVSDLKLSHSEILLGFLQHVLLLPGNEEQQGMLSWAHNAYERQCRGLIPELSARDALIFAQQVCFATLALSQETRGLILADLFSSTGEERIGKLAKLASLAIPKALESEFAQVGRANNLRAGFGLVHAFDLDVHVSQALAEACGYDWNDLLLEAIVERVVPHPPLLLFPLPVEVERKLEQRQTPELVKYMVLLGVASPLRLREAQIAHLAATHGLPLPPLENNNLAWSVHLAAPGVVETAEQAKGALAILHLLGEEANHEDLVVDLLMRLQEPDEWLAKFPSFPTRALDLVHGLAAKQREALAFEVALRPQHLDQCLEFLQTNVRATNEAVDFALLFQRLGLAKPVVRQVLARVERAMLALNSPDFSSSCCRLVVELVLVAKDIHRACELVWKLRKTVGGPSVALLALYLKQTQLGIQTNSSRLRFASDAKRKGAAEGIGRALQRCGESKPAVPQSVFPSSAGWEAELLPAAPKSSEHAKPLRRAKPKAVPTQTSGLEDLLTAAQPPPAKAKSVPVATWDEDELDFQEPSTKAKATAVNDDPLDLLLSSVPSAKKPAKTTLTKKKRPDFPAAEGVDSTLAFLLQPPPAAAFRKKT